MGFRKQTLTIPIDAAVSPAMLLSTNGARFPVALMIIAPATLPETVNIEVIGTTNSGLLTSNGTVIALAAGQATPITIVSTSSIRLKATGNAAADRVFDIEGSSLHRS